MTTEQCFELGYIVKAHGLNGEVKALFDVDIPENYRALESVFVEINKKLIPFFIDKIQFQGGKAVIKFEDVDSIEQTDDLKGCKLFLPLDFLPTLGKNQFYYHEIIGFTIVDKTLGRLGKVTTVYTMPNQDLIAMDYKKNEVLIPIKDEIVLTINREKREVSVDLPEGLLDVYLEE